MAQNYGGIKVVSPSTGSVFVNLTTPSGGTPNVWSDPALTRR
jgi:hypothetical protein